MKIISQYGTSTTKFDIGDTVFIVTDKDQLPRIVTSMVLMPNNLIQYNVAGGEDETSHYEFELSADKTFQL